jgi:hypothetical protein
MESGINEQKTDWRRSKYRVPVGRRFIQNVSACCPNPFFFSLRYADTAKGVFLNTPCSITITAHAYTLKHQTGVENEFGRKSFQNCNLARWEVVYK